MSSGGLWATAGHRDMVVCGLRWSVGSGRQEAPSSSQAAGKQGAGRWAAPTIKIRLAASTPNILIVYSIVKENTKKVSSVILADNLLGVNKCFRGRSLRREAKGRFQVVCGQIVPQVKANGFKAGVFGQMREAGLMWYLGTWLSRWWQVVSKQKPKEKGQGKASGCIRADGRSSKWWQAVSRQSIGAEEREGGFRLYPGRWSSRGWRMVASGLEAETLGGESGEGLHMVSGQMAFQVVASSLEAEALRESQGKVSSDI